MLIIAHRGASKKAPENSLQAFALAVEEGVQRIEMDLHMSKDGEIYLCHEDSTARVGGKNLVISKSTAEEIGAVHLENAEPLVKLSTVLSWWQDLRHRGLDLSLNLEIKPKFLAFIEGLADKIAAIETSWRSYLVLSSYCFDQLERCAGDRVLQHCPRALLWQNTKEYSSESVEEIWKLLQNKMKRCAASMIHPRARDWSQELSWRAQSEGCLVYTWCGGWDQEYNQRFELWERLWQLGVDGHCTDYPLELACFVRQKIREVLL